MLYPWPARTAEIEIRNAAGSVACLADLIPIAAVLAHFYLCLFKRVKAVRRFMDRNVIAVDIRYVRVEWHLYGSSKAKTYETVRITRIPIGLAERVFFIRSAAVNIRSVFSLTLNELHDRIRPVPVRLVDALRRLFLDRFEVIRSQEAFRIKDNFIEISTDPSVACRRISNTECNHAYIAASWHFFERRRTSSYTSTSFLHVCWDITGQKCRGSEIPHNTVWRHVVEPTIIEIRWIVDVRVDVHVELFVIVSIVGLDPIVVWDGINISNGCLEVMFADEFVATWPWSTSWRVSVIIVRDRFNKKTAITNALLGIYESIGRRCWPITVEKPFSYIVFCVRRTFSNDDSHLVIIFFWCNTVVIPDLLTCRIPILSVVMTRAAIQIIVKRRNNIVIVLIMTVQDAI